MSNFIPNPNKTSFQNVEPPPIQTKATCMEFFLRIWWAGLEIWHPLTYKNDEQGWKYTLQKRLPYAHPSHQFLDSGLLVRVVLSLAGRQSVTNVGLVRQIDATGLFQVQILGG